jgi:hypothetical protein
MKVKTLAEAESRYGKIAFGKWEDETKWMSILKVPEAVAKYLLNGSTGLPTRKIYCNKDMHEPLSRAFQSMIDRGLVGELDTFDGCFNIRLVRGGVGPSTHSYGLAIDINAKDNPLGAKPILSEALVSCFLDEGFDWGGNFARRDGMHFSYAWETRKTSY